MREIMRFLGWSITLAAMAILLISVYKQKKATNEQYFSNYTLLMSSWDKYKARFISPEGRVIDYSANEVTTSEGQSYAMLRAVWADDRETFERVWRWTWENLKRSEDNLFGWRWGVVNGQGGFVPPGGENSASDADNDIAYALILAAKRWQQSDYEDRAREIIADIWELETVGLGNNRYLAAGNWAITKNEAVINPSYFVYYAWREFAKIDPDRNWMRLVDSSYEILNRATELSLDENKSGGLPPNWFVLNLTNGQIEPSAEGGLNTYYSYDAVRIPWRVSFDYQQSADARAYQYLVYNFASLRQYYKENGHLPSVIDHSGEPVSEVENPVMYATALEVFAHTDRQLAQKIFQEKIINLYALDRSTFREDLPYYEQNWLWFGVALFNNQINWDE